MDEMGKSVPALSASKICLVLKGRREHALLKLCENKTISTLFLLQKKIWQENSVVALFVYKVDAHLAWRHLTDIGSTAQRASAQYLKC